MKTYSGRVTRLSKNQVFVFGSNKQGFHGAGAAGFASFGVPGNSWRKFNYDRWPDGRRGMWNVKGVSEGIQLGEMGSSYAIPTVYRAGAQSLGKQEIIEGITRMYDYASNHPDKEFLVAYSTERNLNGYSTGEMAEMFAVRTPPENVVFEENFAKILQQMMASQDS